MTSYRRQVAAERYVERHITWCFTHRRMNRMRSQGDVLDISVTHASDSVYIVETPPGVYSSADSPWMRDALLKRPEAALLDTLTQALTELEPTTRALRIEHHGALQRDLIIQGTGDVTTVFGAASQDMHAKKPDLAFAAGRLHDVVANFEEIVFVHVAHGVEERTKVVWRPSGAPVVPTRQR